MESAQFERHSSDPGAVSVLQIVTITTSTIGWQMGSFGRDFNIGQSMYGVWCAWYGSFMYSLSRCEML
eukprot:5337069-Karenia_brevis.AAC.1